MKGLVTKSTGSWYSVKAEDGKDYECTIRGKFRLEDKRITNPVAVGDNVVISNEYPYVINQISDRKNYIIRQSVKKRGQGHILATNLDQAILIATLSSPRTSYGFIDRFLISAEAFRIPQLLIINKSDLIGEKEQVLLARYLEIYQNIGVKCLITSALTGEGIEEFRAELEGKTSLVSGHSGVGKSTLLNMLDIDINQKTDEISTFSDKGKHTTTFAEMFFLSENTRVIDTPGIKELGLLEMEP
ncbi:MAG: ribosome small subunit-dependent GTPase A, partial [Cyclobacteriaceae bacterium]|nr:ribosome small subunit-dependent GTPase A [Cyclobacteriaceae bacterium]